MDEYASLVFNPAHADSTSCAPPQGGTIRVKCTAEKLDSRSKHDVKAVLTPSSDEWNPLGPIYFE